jgi:hypothetical protein
MILRVAEVLVLDAVPCKIDRTFNTNKQPSQNPALKEQCMRPVKAIQIIQRGKKGGPHNLPASRSRRNPGRTVQHILQHPHFSRGWVTCRCGGIRYPEISYIIITIKYTSRETTQPAFKSAVNNKIKDAIEETIAVLNNNGGLFKLFSLKNDFPDLYYQMQSDNATSAVSKELKFTKTFFPYFTGNYTLIFNGCTFYNKDGAAFSFTISASNPTGEAIDNTWKLILNYNPADIKNQEDVYVLISIHWNNCAHHTICSCVCLRRAYQPPRVLDNFVWRFFLKK